MRWLPILMLLGCGSPGGFPPIARIDLEPRYVPENDQFETAVLLNGASSCDELDHPQSCTGGDDGVAPSNLEFRWSFATDRVRIEGDIYDPVLRMWIRGDRAFEIELVVTDADGTSAAAQATVGIILDF